MSIVASAHSRAAIQILAQDLDTGTYDRLAGSRVLSWDVETTGLDWQTDELATVQIYDGDVVTIVRRLGPRAPLLQSLLEDSRVLKLFHHAMFDLRFMAATWNASPVNVACTKIAAKLLRVPKSAQSLQPLLARYLGATLDKQQQTSNWKSEALSSEQLTYAAGDVIYLEALLGRLRAELEAVGHWDLAKACFAHLPTRVALDIQRYDDLFVY